MRSRAPTRLIEWERERAGKLKAIEWAKRHLEWMRKTPAEREAHWRAIQAKWQS